MRCSFYHVLLAKIKTFQSVTQRSQRSAEQDDRLIIIYTQRGANNLEKASDWDVNN